MGRRIHTSIALAYNAINCLDMGNCGNMILKIDITKAFNTIYWDFLARVLGCMNFFSHFVEMITGILQSASLSILINGTPHGYFACSRGVCQGDPLSPLLFCLVEEAIARWIDHAISVNRFRVHDRLTRHLFYADDIIIFLKALSVNARNIHQILIDYGNLSG